MLPVLLVGRIRGKKYKNEAQLLLGSFSFGLYGSDGACSIARIRVVVFVAKHVMGDFLPGLSKAA